MRRYKWLYNSSEPDAHPVYEVRTNAMRILASGLAGADFVQVETLVGPAPTGVAGQDYMWVPLARQGMLVQLTPSHNHFLEIVPGYYRVDVSGVDPARLPDLAIYAVEDEASNDSKAVILVESAELACSRDLPA